MNADQREQYDREVKDTTKKSYWHAVENGKRAGGDRFAAADDSARRHGA